MTRADVTEQLGFLEHKACTVAQLQRKRILAFQTSVSLSSLCWGRGPARRGNRYTHPTTLLGRVYGHGSDSAQWSMVVGNAGSRMHCTSCSCLPFLWPWAQIFLRRMGSASISLSGELPLPREPVRPLLLPKSTAEVARGSFHHGHLIYFILSIFSK